MVFLVGGSDVLELPVEILLLHDYTFGDPEVFKTLADSFLNKSLTVIKCLNKSVVSVCELALTQLENFFNWLAGHQTGWGLIVLQVINDLLDLASVFLNRSLEVLLGASDARARALTNFE